MIDAAFARRTQRAGVSELEIFGGDSAPVGQQHGAFDRVFQFPDVARPLVAHQEFQRVGLQHGHLLLQLSRESLDEGSRERRHIRFPLAERRHVDGDDVEPVVQVITEGARLHHRRQVAVRGRDQPDVDLDGARTAQPFEFVLLQYTQDLRLGIGAHVADLVQEQRAPVGLFEAANPLLVGAGERPLLVAEEFRFQQVLLKRRAVDLDEIARRAVGVVMDGARDQFLAGAGLAADEDGGMAPGDLADDAEYRFEGAARADDAVEVVDVVLRVAEVVDLVLHAAHLERLTDFGLHLFDFERLLHVVERA